MHHHKACKGKAHGSGIAKQNSRTTPTPGTRPGSRASPMQKKDSKSSLNGRSDSDGSRKVSRNSVSSWEYSDTDSLNSSEHGIDSVDHASNMIKKIDHVLNGMNDKNSPDGSKRSLKTPRRNGDSVGEVGGKKLSKRESWAETLRGSRVDPDKYKKMEAGWDDSSIIKVPKERKWHRITAEIEQRPGRKCCDRSDNTVTRSNSLPKKTSPALRKVVKRTRSSPVRTLYDVVEWEELLELAQARKATNPGNGASKPAYLKDLRTLLENKAPQPFKVFDIFDHPSVVLGRMYHPTITI